MSADPASIEELIHGCVGARAPQTVHIGEHWVDHTDGLDVVDQRTAWTEVRAARALPLSTVYGGERQQTPEALASLPQCPEPPRVGLSMASSGRSQVSVGSNTPARIGGRPPCPDRSSLPRWLSCSSLDAA